LSYANERQTNVVFLITFPSDEIETNEPLGPPQCRFWSMLTQTFVLSLILLLERTCWRVSLVS